MKRFLQIPSRKTLLIEIAICIVIIFAGFLTLSIPLTESQNRALIAKTIINIKTLQKQAEIYYLNDNSYGKEISNCFSGIFSDKKISLILSEITKEIEGEKQIWCETSLNGSRYAIEIDRPINQKKICIDSTGYNDVSKGTFDGVCTR